MQCKQSVNLNSTDTSPTKKLYRIAFALSIFTIVYNVAEGILSSYFGMQDHSLTLFGFGMDSFIETISAIGVAHMIIRIVRSPQSNRGEFEVTALKTSKHTEYLTNIFTMFFKTKVEGN